MSGQGRFRRSPRLDFPADQDGICEVPPSDELRRTPLAGAQSRTGAPPGWAQEEARKQVREWGRVEWGAPRQTASYWGWAADLWRKISDLWLTDKRKCQE